jgi:hypothetical protein
MSVTEEESNKASNKLNCSIHLSEGTRSFHDLGSIAKTLVKLLRKERNSHRDTLRLQVGAYFDKIVMSAFHLQR